MNTQLTRNDALAQGKTRYYTGRPCKHGHDAERFVSTGGCVRCNSERSKLFVREANRASTARLQGQFIYPLHADDHAAALAYCQALDMQRARKPHIPTVRAVSAVDIEAARRHALGRAAEQAISSQSGPDPMDSAMEQQMRDLGFIR